MKPLPVRFETADELAASLGVVRNKRIIVQCSGCGVGCYAVEPLGCFCVRCYARNATSAPPAEKP